MKLSWIKKPYEAPKSLLDPPKELPGFEGQFFYRRADKEWPEYIPIPQGPINYLEIGCAYGGNAILVSKSYAHHPDSKLYCVDPWMDYDEYPEYKGRQDIAWETFNKNIRTCADVSKFIIHRGFSDSVVPTFPDDFFDLIFVDGNHETEYVYRDGMMSLEKVKVGGYIVFDDYIKHWSQTVDGVDKFVVDAGERIKIIPEMSPIIGQYLVKRVF